jgi:hypothetical protein
MIYMKTPFMALRKVGFFLCQCGWKPECSDNLQLKKKKYSMSRQTCPVHKAVVFIS